MSVRAFVVCINMGVCSCVKSVHVGVAEVVGMHEWLRKGPQL